MSLAATQQWQKHGPSAGIGIRIAPGRVTCVHSLRLQLTPLSKRVKLRIGGASAATLGLVLAPLGGVPVQGLLFAVLVHTGNELPLVCDRCLWRTEQPDSLGFTRTAIRRRK